MPYPTVNWPETSGTYIRLVQWEHEGIPYLRLDEEAIHDLILDDIFEEFGVTECVDSILEGENPKCKIPGMGRVDTDLKGHVASFYGISDGFKIGIDITHLKRIEEVVNGEWQILYKDQPL